MRDNDRKDASDGLALTAAAGCTHVPPGSKFPCMVYGCPGPAPTTMSAAVAGMTRIEELTAELEQARAELASRWTKLARALGRAKDAEAELAERDRELAEVRPVVEAAVDQAACEQSDDSMDKLDAVARTDAAARAFRAGQARAAGNATGNVQEPCTPRAAETKGQDHA